MGFKQVLGIVLLATIMLLPLTAYTPKVEAAGAFAALLNFDDYRNRMGSVTPMQPSTTFYFPHFHQDSNWQTFMAVVNPSSTDSATVTFTAYRDDGALVNTAEWYLGPGVKVGGFVNQIIPGTTGTGWIEVHSDLPIVGILNFDDYTNRMGSMSGVYPYMSICFPHFHQDANWQTFYAIVNPSDFMPVHPTITYYRDDGSVAGTESLTLSPHHKIGRFAISGSGWIAVWAEYPIVGMLNFDDYHNRMGTIEYAIPSRTLYFPHFQQDANWQTFYAIANPSDTSTSITVTYYREDGSIIGTDTSTLGGHCKLGRFAVAGTGWIKVESPGWIVGMLNFDDYHNRMGSIVAATPLESIIFPHFHQDSSWQTFYAIVNLGGADAFTSTYYGADGSTIAFAFTTLAVNSKIGRFATGGTGWLRIHWAIT